MDLFSEVLQLCVSNAFGLKFVSDVAYKKMGAHTTASQKTWQNMSTKWRGEGYKMSHYTFNALSATSLLAANLAKQTDPIKYSLKSTTP